MNTGYTNPSIYRKIFLIPVIMGVSVIAVYFSIIYGGTSPYVLEYRYYRVVEAYLSGLVLGAAGALLQSSLRNPLVDHHILGIGSGALFTAYLTILLAGPLLGVSVYTAIMGGLIAYAITTLIAERIGGTDTAYVLSGLGVNALFSGAAILLSYYILVENPYALMILIGSFILASPRYFPPLLISIILVTATYPILAKPLNTLLLGDDYAHQLGYDPRRTRLIAAVVAGTASSIVVGCFGLIGFIGLVSPHIARLLTRSGDNRVIIPLSGLLGGTILLLTDDASRLLLSTITGEVPAGAIASLIGAPFFLILLLGRRGGPGHP